MIGERLSNDWKYIGRLASLRLKKSGIEYVILAGSSLFAVSVAKSCFCLVLVMFWRAQRAIFSRILTFRGPGSKKIARPQGHLNQKRRIPYHFFTYHPTLEMNQKSGRYHSNTGKCPALARVAVGEGGLGTLSVSQGRLIQIS